VRRKSFWQSFSGHSRIDFDRFRSTFESALRQKAVRRAACLDGVCAATLIRQEGPLPARRALQPSSLTTHLTRKARQAARLKLAYLFQRVDAALLGFAEVAQTVFVEGGFAACGVARLQARSLIAIGEQTLIPSGAFAIE